MSVMYQMDPIQRLLYVRMAGRIRSDDLFAFLKALASDPDVQPAQDYLGDYHAATLSPISEPILFGLSCVAQRLVEQFKPGSIQSARQALIVSPHNADQFRHLLAVIHPHIRTRRYFSHLATARAWLDLPESWMPPDVQARPRPLR